MSMPSPTLPIRATTFHGTRTTAAGPLPAALLLTLAGLVMAAAFLLVVASSPTGAGERVPDSEPRPAPAPT